MPGPRVGPKSRIFPSWGVRPEQFFLFAEYQHGLASRRHCVRGLFIAAPSLAPSMTERPVALSRNRGYANMILRIADDFQSIAASLKKLERDKEAATVADVPLYSADLPISHRRSCG